jgi:tetratricopeptide (TPR) repeat protein
MNFWGRSMEVHEISPLVRDPEARGTLPSRLAPLARHRGFKVALVEGSVPRLRKAIDRGVPPLIMIESRGGDFHFFVVSGYNDPEGQVVCEEYQDSKRLIPYEQLETLWEKPGRVMLEIEPATAEADFRAGADRESKGLFAEALFLYRRALQADPEHYEARVGAGNCLLAAGKIEEALKEYEHARRLDPDDPKVLNNLAHLYLGLKRDPEEAERLAERASGRFEEEFRRAKEETDRETGPARRAAREKELSWKERDWAYALGTLGQARAAGGKHALAIAAWKASCDHLPLTEPDARARRLREIGLAYRAQGMPAEATQHLEQALREARDPALRAKIEESLK